MSAPRIRRLLAAAAAVSAAAGSAAASDLYVGPGYFAQIDDALAAAQPGDRIFVAAGNYEHFELSKPVEIQGGGRGVTTIGVWSSSDTTVVRDVPAGAVATIAGLSFENAWFLTETTSPIVEVKDCAGTVTLLDVSINLAPQAAHSGAGLWVTDCARLIVQGATIRGSRGSSVFSDSNAGLLAWRSTLDVSDTVLAGTSSAAGGSPAVSGAPGAWLTDSAARFARVRATGSAGVGGGAGFLEPYGGAGVVLDGSTLVLAGGPGNELAGGNGVAPHPGGAGLRATAGSTALVAADVVLLGGSSGGVRAPDQEVDPGSAATTLAWNLPALVPDPQATLGGGPFALRHTGEPGALVVPAFSGGLGPAAAIPGLEGLAHLDLAHLAPLPALVLDGTGAGATTGVVPSVPSLAGTHVWIQAAEVAGGAVRLSNPARMDVL